MPSYIPVSGLPMIDEDEATGRVAEIFDQTKREFQIPYVPNGSRAMASSPGALAFYTDLTRLYYEHIGLPQSLSTMIFFAIAKKNNCTYCTAARELSCRTLGIDEELLTDVIEDLDNVRPERLRAIMNFVIKGSTDPQGLVEADYEELREQGLSDAEMVEIATTIALGKFMDTLADISKIEVDENIVKALSEMKQ
jgi:uncharacterized peroxidase-related enzyme